MSGAEPTSSADARAQRGARVGDVMFVLAMLVAVVGVAGAVFGVLLEVRWLARAGSLTLMTSLTAAALLGAEYLGGDRFIPRWGPGLDRIVFLVSLVVVVVVVVVLIAVVLAVVGLLEAAGNI